MHARFFSVFFLFALLVAVLAAPIPEQELASDVESEIVARSDSTLETRANKGRATYYNPSAGTGACGWNNSDNEKVVALDPSKYKGKCGKYVNVSFGGKSVRCKVVDLCPGCPNNALDLSPTAFKALAPLSKGVLQATWSFS